MSRYTKSTINKHPFNSRGRSHRQSNQKRIIGKYTISNLTVELSVLDIKEFKLFFQLLVKYKDELPEELKEEINNLINILEG